MARDLATQHHDGALPEAYEDLPGHPVAVDVLAWLDQIAAEKSDTPAPEENPHP